MAADASIFITPHTASDLFLLNQRVNLFLSFVNFYLQTFWATFYLILLHLSTQILTFEIDSFKPLRYNYECNNWHKLQKQTKLRIFLFRRDLNLRAYGHFVTKKSASTNILRYDIFAYVIAKHKIILSWPNMAIFKTRRVRLTPSERSRL